MNSMGMTWAMAADDPKGGGGGGAAPVTVSGGGGGDPPPAMKFPDGLPDHVKGKDYPETVDKLWGAYKGWRDEVATRGQVPKTADEYQISYPDDVRESFGDLAKDPTVRSLLGVLHESGVTDKQVQAFLPKFLAEELKAGRGVGANRLDPVAEAKALLGDEGKSLQPEQLKAKASERQSAALEWVAGLKRANTLPEKSALLLEAFAETADGVKLIEGLRGMERTEHGPQLGGQGGGTAITRDELRERNADPRGNPNSPKFEPGFAKETERLYQQMYKGKAA